MRYPNRVLFRVVAVLFASLMAPLSCSDDTTAPPPDDQTSASRTIPPTGGSVSVENEDGIEFSVSLPAGAVLTGTKVTIAAVTPPSGVNARFSLEPAGLRLLKPATFTVTLPSTMTIHDSFGMSFANGERVFVPCEIDAGARTITTTLNQLGFTNPDDVQFTTGALSPDNFIDVDQMSCDIIRDALTDQILRAQAFSGPFPPDLASPLITEYRAALLVCTSLDSVSEASAALREYACANVNSSEATAGVAEITSVEDLRTNLGYLVAAEGMAQVFGADCHIQTATMEAVFDKYLDDYVDRINSPEFTRDRPTWDALWAENLVIVGLGALAQEYAVDAASQRINDEVFPALFARLYEVASAACSADENNAFMLDIITGGYALNHPIIVAREVPSFSGLVADDVIDETLRCGSTIQAEARASDNLLLASETVSLDDETGSVRVTDNGKIVLIDDMLGFTCNGIVSRPPIRVRAEVPGHLPIVQLGNLSGSMTIPMPSTLSSLPEEEPGEPADNFDLIIERDRNVCGIEAEGTIELARIHVNTTGFLGTMSGTWSGGCPNGAVQGTFSVQIQSDRTVTGGFDGSATGTIDGTVSTNGTFDASANGTAGSCTWSGSLNLAGGVVNGSGSWSCSSAGCSGTYASGSIPGASRR